MALVDIYARHADDGHAWIPKPINKQGPLLNYDAMLKEVYELLTIYPQVWIYDSATKKVINLSNLSEYFPDYDPGGGVTPEQLAAALQGKVDKVDGKILSTNDYTDDEKTKLSGIETGANKTIVDNDFSDVSTNPLQNKVITELFQPISQSDYDALETYTKPLYFILDDEED